MLPERKPKTFYIKEGSKRFKLHTALKATLGTGDLREAVKLPNTNTDVKDWIALNIIDFFEQIHLLFEAVVEYCTDSSCPVMSAGPKYEYLWADGKHTKEPVKVSARTYINYLFSWVNDILDDKNIFPIDDTPFPKQFLSIVRTIFKRIFRVYAHIYYNHPQQIANLGIGAHFSTSFKHFYLFIREFGLVEPSELAPLQEHIDKIDAGPKDNGVRYDIQEEEESSAPKLERKNSTVIIAQGHKQLLQWLQNLQLEEIFRKLVLEWGINSVDDMKYITEQQINDLQLKPVPKNKLIFELSKLKPMVQHYKQLQHIEKQEFLGGGFFGEVFRGLWNGTTVVALKTCRHDEQKADLFQELDILTNLSHPNVVRFFGIWAPTPDEIYLVTEFLNEGSLEVYLRKHKDDISVKELLAMAMQAAAGMQYLETQNVVHRDLSLRNLLISTNSAEHEKFVIKVADFGLSRATESGFYKSSSRKIPVKWMAPEILLNEEYNYTSKSDIWSFGVALWEVLFHNLDSKSQMFTYGEVTPYPGKTKDETIEFVQQGKRMQCPSSCPPQVHQLMLKCWHQKPEERPSFMTVFQTLQNWYQTYSTNTQRSNTNSRPPLPTSPSAPLFEEPAVGGRRRANTDYGNNPAMHNFEYGANSNPLQNNTNPVHNHSPKKNPPPFVNNNASPLTKQHSFSTPRQSWNMAAQNLHVSPPPKSSSFNFNKQEVKKRDLEKLFGKTEGSIQPPDPNKLYFAFQDLIHKEKVQALGLDALHLEVYLTPQEFYDVFGITFENFMKLPEWKRKEAKKIVGLF